MTILFFLKSRYLPVHFLQVVREFAYLFFQGGGLHDPGDITEGNDPVEKELVVFGIHLHIEFAQQARLARCIILLLIYAQM